MTHEDYEALVQRLERYAKVHPRGYALRVGALSGFGYAYVWLVLAVAVGLLLGFVRLGLRGELRGGGLLQITLSLVLLVYTTVRALWVPFERPMGIPIGRAETPGLTALVDELVGAVRARPFDEVVVSGDCNASVSQIPRFGLLGGYRNFLVVGLPLAHALTEEEFRAVLAHEVAHLSRAHGRFASWIYRVRTMWVRLSEQMQARRTWGAWLFEWFLRRWSPYFNAYSFVLARTQEREADRFAARAAGAAALGTALMKLEIIGACLERPFWDGVGRRLADLAEPPVGVMGEFVVAVSQPVPPAEGARRLAQALGRRTGLADTHPSLAERLSSLGLAVPEGEGAAAQLAAPRIGASAADRYFAEGGRGLLGLLDERWRELIRQRWIAGHEEMKGQAARLAELNARAAGGPLDTALSWERADLTLGLRGAAAAEPLLRELLQRAPEHAPANLALGAMLLDRDDEAGLALVNLAVAHPACREDGYALLVDHFERHGRAEEAKRYRRLAWAAGTADQLRRIPGARELPR